MTGGFEFDGDAPADSQDSLRIPRTQHTPRTGDDADADSDATADSDADADPDATVDSDATTDSETDHGVVDSDFAALLYGGETVEASVPIDEGHLVVTSHRLLVYTPDADGRTLTVIQRPNVEGVAISASGRGEYVSPALKAILFGGLLVGVGAVLPVDGLAGAAPSASGTSAIGMGGTVALLGDLLAVIALLDDMLRALGALVLLVGVALLGLYLNSRTREVVVSVAGEEDHRVPAVTVAEADVERLGRKFEPVDAQSWPSLRSSWPR